ncbi:MAG: SDR family oxidoreductase [Actinomycetia bacterium]|nr:SDR family oxidoreductase [Actinomycetes bacterium]
MKQKSIFITGAAGGIGRATALLFHSQGWFVGCYDIDSKALDVLCEELGTRCVAGVLDVTDKHAFDDALAHFATCTEGHLDLMFNNAGIAFAGYLDDVPFEKVRSMVEVNIMGVLNGIHAAIPLLKRTAHSLCFTTSSSAATFGAPGMAVYSATKYAVKGLTEALSVELARYGSRAADVSPGIIDTTLWDGVRYAEGAVPTRLQNMAVANRGRTDAGRTLPPEDVAACVWDAYHGDQVHWYLPPELVDRDRAKATDPEKLRDELIAQAADRSAARHRP